MCTKAKEITMLHNKYNTNMERQEALTKVNKIVKQEMDTSPLHC